MPHRIRLMLVASVLALAFAIFTHPQLIAAPAASSPRVLDLGHPLSDADPTWTGEKLFSRTAVGTVAKDGYTGGRFSSDEHFGTHFDAPAHFGGAWTVDKVPVERLVNRPGIAINIESQSRTNEDYRLTMADVQAFERKNGDIPEGAVVFITTGWDRFWTDPVHYRNERQGVKHFPGISAEAAAYLAKQRKVAGIGIDTLSVDYGPSTAFEAHKTTMVLNVYHVENAANLTKLLPKGFTVTVAPIDIAGGSGGPTRVFAVMP
jgi:kynurenine formamidase